MQIKHCLRRFFPCATRFIHTTAIVQSSMKNYSRQFFLPEGRL
jgi:hypothetical protein